MKHTRLDVAVTRLQYICRRYASSSQIYSGKPVKPKRRRKLKPPHDPPPLSSINQIPFDSSHFDKFSTAENQSKQDKLDEFGEFDEFDELDNLNNLHDTNQNQSSQQQKHKQKQKQQQPDFETAIFNPDSSNTIDPNSAEFSKLPIKQQKELLSIAKQSKTDELIRNYISTNQIRPIFSNPKFDRFYRNSNLEQLNNQLNNTTDSNNLIINNVPFQILAEDDAYFFVYKPANIKLSKFYENILQYWIAKYPFYRWFPTILHTLDENESGVMVFGKRWSAEQHFRGLLRNSKSEYILGSGIKRCYLCVCKGIPVAMKESNTFRGNMSIINRKNALKKSIANTDGIVEGIISRCFNNYKRFAIYPNKKTKKYLRDMKNRNKGKNKKDRKNSIESATFDLTSSYLRADFDGSDEKLDVFHQTPSDMLFDMQEKESGKYVRTEYKVLDTCEHGTLGTLSLVLFTATTNKRHQIRASASALGCPIVGDVLYGGQKYTRQKKTQLMLHSLFLGFEGIPDSDLIYAVSAMPKWSHLNKHIWSTKAQYFVKKHIDYLMKVPRPVKQLSHFELFVFSIYTLFFFFCFLFGSVRFVRNLQKFLEISDVYILFVKNKKKYIIRQQQQQLYIAPRTKQNKTKQK